MSRLGSSAESRSSSAQSLLAMSSSTSWPRTMIRWCSSRSAAERPARLGPDCMVWGMLRACAARGRGSSESAEGGSALGRDRGAVEHGADLRCGLGQHPGRRLDDVVGHPRRGSRHRDGHRLRSVRHRHGDTAHADLLLALVERVADAAHLLHGGQELRGALDRGRGVARHPGAREEGDDLLVREAREDRLADRSRVRPGAPPDLGEHPHEVLRRLDLGDVDDLVAVEGGQVDRLPELCHRGGHRRARPRTDPLGRIVGQAHQPWAQGVLAGRLLAHVAEVDQGAHQPVDGGEGQVGLLGELREADDASGVGHRLQDREGAVEGLDPTGASADIRLGDFGGHRSPGSVVRRCFRMPEVYWAADPARCISGRSGWSSANACSKEAATLTAITAGSLPLNVGRPIGVTTRAMASSPCPSAARFLRNRLHLALEPISPIEPRWVTRSAASTSAASSAWSCVITSTCVPRGSSPSTSSGSTGTWWRWTRATASSSPPSTRSSSCSGRESTTCRSTSWRARIRASSIPTWPIPKIATAGSTASGSSSTGTSPPQHWTPCSTGALSLSWEVNSSGRASGSASSSRARSTATASRFPPPTEPQVRAAATTILAPASRGACPRTAATVTSTPASRRARSCSTASSHSIVDS